MAPEVGVHPHFAIRRLGGYDPDAVDAWVRTANAEIAQLRRHVTQQAEELERLRSAEASVARAVTSAQLMAERLVEETNEEATRRRTMAAAEADAAVSAAREQAERVLVEARSAVARERSALEEERARVMSEIEELRRIGEEERTRIHASLMKALAAVSHHLPERQVLDAPASDTIRTA